MWLRVINPLATYEGGASSNPNSSLVLFAEPLRAMHKSSPRLPMPHPLINDIESECSEHSWVNFFLSFKISQNDCSFLNVKYAPGTPKERSLKKNVDLLTFIQN